MAKTNERRTNQARIYEELKKEIHGGLLTPSEVLVIDVLAERFGVSRTPVREALIALCNEGLLEGKHHVGFIVTPVNIREVVETYRLRVLLEKESVRLAAQYILPEDLKRLEATLSEPGRNFHSLIAAVSGWGVLAEVLESMMDKTERFRALFVNSQRRLKEENVVRRYRHQEIYDAISDGDEEKAVFFMEMHLDETRQYILKALSLI